MLLWTLPGRSTRCTASPFIAGGLVNVATGTSWRVHAANAFSSCGSTSFFLTSPTTASVRSEEHTSELQSQSKLVCRLLLEKKKRFSSAPQQLVAHGEGVPVCSTHRLLAQASERVLTGVRCGGGGALRGAGLTGTRNDTDAI